MWSVRTMEYDSASLENEVLIHATMWMIFENMLNERSQLQNAMQYVPVYMKCPE